MPRPDPARECMRQSVLPILLLGCFLPSRMAAAQSATLETSYIVLGGQGPVVRAILTNASQCPSIELDGVFQPMRVRAEADASGNFPDLVCEFSAPPETTTAAINGQALPLPRPALNAIAGLGDTGCRLKAANGRTAGRDREDNGKIQDCDNTAKWPFSMIAKRIAAAKPDLVIHVGDYLYRESPCPKEEKGCAGSPYGDNWSTWSADFFVPAAPLLRAAPWIMTRGNHEICKRAGAGYFRYLDPTPAQAPPACMDFMPFYTARVGNQSFIVLDSSDAADTCSKTGCNAEDYAEQFATMHPPADAWLVTHRPVWGLKNRRVTLNATLQTALAPWQGRLPPGISLVLAGHIHLWEALSFTDGRSPQLVVGNAGTLLAHKINQPLRGQKIGGVTVRFGRSEHEWGYTLFTPKSDRGSWTASYYGVDGVLKFNCSISPAAVTC
jgi:hypothetical protein